MVRASVPPKTPTRIRHISGSRSNRFTSGMTSAAARHWILGGVVIRSNTVFTVARPSSAPSLCPRTLTQVPRLRSPPVLLSNRSSRLHGTPTPPAAVAGSVGSPPVAARGVVDAPLVDEFSVCLQLPNPGSTPPFQGILGHSNGSTAAAVEAAWVLRSKTRTGGDGARARKVPFQMACRSAFGSGLFCLG